MKVVRETIKHPLFWIFALALGLRWWAADHGLPFIYDIDEPALVRSTTGLRFDSNPHHFDWPHLHFYLNYFVSFVLFYGFRGLLQVLKLKNSVEALFPIIWQDPAVFYLVARLFGGLLGALTVIPVFLTGKVLRGRTLGLVAALLLAVFPYHVQESHKALIDIPTTFWVAWAVYFSARVVSSEKLSNYLWTGVFIGLAASTKYNGVFVALVLVLAHFIRVLGLGDLQLPLSERVSGKLGIVLLRRTIPNFLGALNLRESLKLFLAGIASIAAFFIGTPYALLDWKTFTGSKEPTGALWQFNNVGSVPLAHYWIQVYESFWLKMVFNLGLVLTIIFIAKLLSLFVRKWSKADFFTAPFIIIYFLLVARGVRYASSYYLIAYPLIALLLGAVIVSLAGRLSPIFGEKRLSIGLFLLLLNPLGMVINNNRLFSRDDTRQLADIWVTENVEEGQRLFLVGDGAPVLSKDNLRKRQASLGQFRGMLVGDVLEEFDFIILNELLEISKFRLVKEIHPQDQLGPDVYIYENIKCNDGSSCQVEILDRDR